ncbi:hypothetical protein SAMN04487967_2611 [Natronorubrum sediminis]|uniref:Uncharacterized protein n=1 Tax=Natronorubrum sediminis TaxID=640943 RepID=A0A1H6G1S8_9EURY|nr:hypothetical protein [Natronorubrum sediminis]SEH16418.1 hypothetical protein SAMN04487967_2611 [Natronorubrum sediminis]
MEFDSTPSSNAQSASEAESSGESMLTRRNFGKGAAVAAGVSGAGLGYLWWGSQPALAVDNPEEWIANSAEITTEDGTVDAVTFGDPDEIEDSEELEDDDNRLIVEWSGFDDDRELDFAILLAGTDGGDGGDWTGGEEPTETTESEEVAAGTEQVEGTTGSEAFTWEDVFGESQPVSVADHSEIDLTDFEAPEDGETTVRELEATLEVVVPEQGDLTVTETATATITVTNEEADLEIGGQGTFEIESDEEVVGGD